jgi:hypothetical protein
VQQPHAQQTLLPKIASNPANPKTTQIYSPAARKTTDAWMLREMSQMMQDSGPTGIWIDVLWIEKT